jgi:hypothetical protein
VRQGIPDTLPLRHDVRFGSGRHRLRRPRRTALAVELDEVARHLHQADAVADRVMQLHDHRGAASGEVVDHVELPQRPCLVEGLHGDHLRHVEHRAPRPIARRLQEAAVKREVEVGIDLPNAAKLVSDISKARSKPTRRFTRAEFDGTGLSRGCDTVGDVGTLEGKADIVVEDTLDEIDP